MFDLISEYEDYRDFEPHASVAMDTPFGSLSRITFDDENHTTYGSIANPNATLDNDEPLSTGETVTIPWDDALKLINAV